MFLMILRAEVERLEAVKTELHRQIAEEVKPWFSQFYLVCVQESIVHFHFLLQVKINVKLQSYVETRKEALYERRVVLERNVSSL